MTLGLEIFKLGKSFCISGLLVESLATSFSQISVDRHSWSNGCLFVNISVYTLVFSEILKGPFTKIGRREGEGF